MKQPIKNLLLIFIVLPFFVSNCTSPICSSSERVCHMVFCWLKKPGDEQVKSDLIKASKSFNNIPGVISVSTGETIPSDRPIVDSSYDLAIMIILKNKAALEQYLINPKHKSAQKEILKPNVKKILIYDFVME